MISGKIVYEAVVFPAPLHPAIIYKFLSVTIANLGNVNHTAIRFSFYFQVPFWMVKRHNHRQDINQASAKHRKSYVSTALNMTKNKS